MAQTRNEGRHWNLQLNYMLSMVMSEGWFSTDKKMHPPTYLSKEKIAYCDYYFHWLVSAITVISVTLCPQIIFKKQCRLKEIRIPWEGLKPLLYRKDKSQEGRFQET